ncbi:hypothetical protein MFM001_14060 [Mycobacterium sp. MFM001]|nr:hypothetical protein MFM001_14060 [Mycobacterium sp. MFM001]
MQAVVAVQAVVAGLTVEAAAAVVPENAWWAIGMAVSAWPVAVRATAVAPAPAVAAAGGIAA